MVFSGFGIWYLFLRLSFQYTHLQSCIAGNYHVPTEYAGKWSPASGMHCSRGAVIMQVGKGVS